MKRALDVALDYLSQRAMAEHEIKQRLERKGFSADDVREALAQLREWNYINDVSYAEIYCQTRGNRYSRRKISEDLRQKGIGREVINRALLENYPTEQEAALCKELARTLWAAEKRRMKRKAARSDGDLSYQGGEIERLKQRIGQKLAGRGYSLDSIYAALADLTAAED